MRIVLAAVLMALFSGLLYAQDSAAEKAFVKSRPKLKLEKFSEGEDASSGFDYLIYKNKAGVVKIRSIWSGVDKTAKIDDYYYENGKPVLYVSMTFPKSRLKEVIRERTIPLTTVERLHLKYSKLTAWIEKGKTVSATDARWNQRETELLEQARGQLENYQSLKDEK